MENKIFAKQIIDFYKSIFDNSFNSLNVLQQQMEKTFQNFIQQSTWFPSEVKAAINEWGNICNKGRNDFKEVVDNNYKKLEEYFAACESAARTDKMQTPKTT